MIVTNEKELRESSSDVNLKEGLDIAGKLVLELEKNSKGIGLAAPQIGIHKNIFVIVQETGSPIAFINPKILSKKDPFINKGEGCLSFPEKTIDTIRYKKISIIDDFMKKKEVLEGRDALICQHEYDHLNGILMFDRQAPEKYDQCFCESGKKYKFCHFKEINGKK